MKMLKLLSTFILMTTLTTLWGCSGDVSSKQQTQQIQKTAKILLSTDAPIASDTGNQQNPHVIYIPDKNLWFTVYEDWKSGNSVIKGRFIKADGTFNGTEISITSGKGVNNQTVPRAAYKAGDKIVITWHDPSVTTYISYNNITSNSINPNLQATDANGVILGIEAALANEATYTATSRRSPKVIYDTFNDRFVFAWSEIRSAGLNVSYSPIFSPAQAGTYPQERQTGITEVVVYNSKTAALVDSVLPISVKPFSSTSAATAYNRTCTGYSSILSVDLSADTTQNKVLLVWEGQPFTQTVTTTWTDTDTSEAINSDELNTEVAAAFAPGTKNIYGIFAADIAGNATPLRICNQASKSPSVAFLDYTDTKVTPNVSKKQFLAVWEDLRATNEKIYGQLISSSGSLVSANLNLTTSPTGIDLTQSKQTSPIVAIDTKNSRFSVMWSDTRNGTVNSDIYGTYVFYDRTLPAPPYTYNPITVKSGDGAPVHFQISGATGDQTSPYISYNLTTNQYLATWNDKRNNTTKALDVYGQIVDMNLNIDTISIADMKTNSPVSFTLQASNGIAPYTWALVSGAMPTGSGPSSNAASGTGSSTLALDKNGGNIAGTPTLAGDYSFEILVTDAEGSTATKLYSVSVRDSLSITNSSMKSWALNQSGYTETLTGTGGRGTYAWTVVNGSLPAGLTLNSSTGIVSGTPTASGTSAFTVQLSDSGAVQERTTKQFSITISTNMVIATTSMADMKTGVPASITLQASGGTTPYTWSLSKGGLPVGTTSVKPINSADGTGSEFETLALLEYGGNIDGTPTVAGDYSFEITVTDALGQTAVQIFKVTVRDTLTITSASLKSAQLNQAGYAETLTATGGRGVYTWSLLSGSLPTGLTLNSTSGIISGTPIQNGTYTFTIQLSDSGVTVPEKTTKQFSVVVVSPLVISTTILPQAPLNALYSQTLSASGGREPYAWSVLQGALPTGLTVSAATGMITGIPTAPGIYTFVVNLLDADGKTATQTISISTSSTTSPPAALSIITTSLPSGTVNTLYPSTILSATGGTSPRSWSLVSGTLPPGITMASATGVISGIPTAGGNYDLIIQVTDSDLKSTTQSLSIVVVDDSISGGGSVQFADGTSQITSLGYGNAYKGSSTKKTITINNTLSTPVVITNVSSSSSAFYCSGAPFTIAANSSTTLDVTFTPTQISAYSGTITLMDINGNKYQLPVTGSGIGVNVELKSGAGTVSYFNILAPTSLPTQNRPAGFTIQSAADFQITGVTPGATVTVAVTFATMPANPVFYKIVDNEWKAVTGATISGNTVTFDITDDGEMDSNKTPGIIRDPIVVGTSGGGSGTGDNTPPASGSGGGGGCFIATAAFGSYLDPHVMVLRHFRDDVLLQSELGTAFVTFYYKHSPPIADFIAQHDMLRTIMRFALTPLIFAVKYPLGAALLFVCVCAWFIRRKMGMKLQSKMVQQAG